MKQIISDLCIYFKMILIQKRAIWFCLVKQTISAFFLFLLSAWNACRSRVFQAMALEIAVLIDACRRAALNTYCLQVVMFSHLPPFSLFAVFAFLLVEIFDLAWYSVFSRVFFDHWELIKHFFFSSGNANTQIWFRLARSHLKKKNACVPFLSVAKHLPAKNNQNQMDGGKITSSFSYSNLALIWFLFVPNRHFEASCVCNVHANDFCVIDSAAKIFHSLFLQVWEDLKKEQIKFFKRNEWGARN